MTRICPNPLGPILNLIMSTTTPSDSEPEDMVGLKDIPTIGDLFKKAILHPAKKPRYQPQLSYLDRVSLWQGDITKLQLDSIVNAANKSLLGGGGVDGAIHRAAGRKLYEECRTLHGCQTGEAKITKGYNLHSSHIIHTVGPVYDVSDDAVKDELECCYRTSLDLAVKNALKHIAFPSISTGIYGYPIEEATHIALGEGRRFLESDSGDKLDRLIYVVWSNADKAVYERLIPEYFPEPFEEGDEVQHEGETEMTTDTGTKAEAEAEPGPKEDAGVAERLVAD